MVVTNGFMLWAVGDKEVNCGKLTITGPGMRASGRVVGDCVITSQRLGGEKAVKCI